MSEAAIDLKMVIIVNFVFSRGEIVHLPSLVKALEAKKMWGVALDVFEGEKKWVQLYFMAIQYTFFREVANNFCLGTLHITQPQILG